MVEVVTSCTSCNAGNSKDLSNMENINWLTKELRKIRETELFFCHFKQIVGNLTTQRKLIFFPERDCTI